MEFAVLDNKVPYLFLVKPIKMPVIAWKSQPLENCQTLLQFLEWEYTGMVNMYKEFTEVKRLELRKGKKEHRKELPFLKKYCSYYI